VEKTQFKRTEMCHAIYKYRIISLSANFLNTTTNYLLLHSITTTKWVLYVKLQSRRNKTKQE